MNYFKKIFFLLLCLLSLAGVVSAEDQLPKVVIKVGNTPISSQEYLERLMEKDGSITMDQLIVEKVIELELAEMKLPLVTEQQIDGHINLMEKQLKEMQGPYANIATFLANTKMKMSELRRKTKREIGLRRILGSKIEVKEEEMLKYYAEYKNQYYTYPEARRVIAITVFHRESPAPKMLQTDISVDEAKKIATDIRKSWIGDKDYVKTLWDSKKHFIRGYDVPFGIPISLKNDKNFTSVFNAKAGEITDVILDKNGFNIYKVMEDMPAKVLLFDEVKEKIKNELISNKIEKAIEDGVFDNIKKKYKIERFVEMKEEK